MPGRQLQLEMKILVAIANFGTKNDGYLSRVLAEYRSMPYDIDLVVTSNIPKDLGKDVEVLWGCRARIPIRCPLRTNAFSSERKDAYDLFIYTEDDILITQRNIEAFLRVEKILPRTKLWGSFRWEQYPDGTKVLSGSACVSPLDARFPEDDRRSQLCAIHQRAFWLLRADAQPISAGDRVRGLPGGATRV